MGQVSRSIYMTQIRRPSDPARLEYQKMDQETNIFKHPTCYLSPKLKGNIGPDGNKSVIARQSIMAGERLTVWGGEVVTWEMLGNIPPNLRRYTLQIEEELYLVTSHEGPADWVNHSCNPNAGLSGQVVLVAIRNIAPGEEVCYDYAMSDGSPYDEFECHCGAAGCRQRVTGNDWQNPKLRKKYAGYFSPYLQRKIAQLESLELLSQRA